MLAPRLGELTTRADLTISTFRLSDASNECQRQLLALAEPYLACSSPSRAACMKCWWCATGR